MWEEGIDFLFIKSQLGWILFLERNKFVFGIIILFFDYQ